LDADWVDAGNRRTALYNYVPPGKYRFRVIACDSDGVWNETGASLAVTVARHFWQTWWAIGLGSLGLLVAVGATVRLLEKRKLHNRLIRLEQEKALERERTRIAQDLHDEMGAKLCRISFLSENARRGDNMPVDLQHHIASISDASREVLHSLDEIVWAVNPQNDTLEHMASYIAHYAEEYFQMTGIECELDIPAQLPPHPLSSQVRHHVFLAVHETFTNVLKHSAATRAKVTMSCNATTFEISASDNGNGFDPLARKSGSDTTSAESRDGLQNMRRRLADIGGYCQVESEPGKGTTVRFVVPLSRRTQER
jgi:signal transduction histidine kinase